MGCCLSSEMSSSDEAVKYEISVFTSDAFSNAGSDRSVYIELVGVNNKSTGWKKLDNLLRNDFERGSRDVFHIEAEDVGVPLYIRFEMRGSKLDAWACDEVIVSYQDADVSFPVYDWVEDAVAALSGKALTFTQSSVAIRSLRSTETDRARGKYQWVARPSAADMAWGTPRYVDTKSYEELPRIFKQTAKRVKAFDDAGFEGFANAALVTIKNYITGINDLGDFKRLYKSLHLHDKNDPPFIDRWDTDVEFGRQQIMGVTPLFLKRCKSLPDCCRITDAHVAGALNGTTLQQEMEKGKVFIGDYSEVFQGVSRNKSPSGQQLYCPDAIGLFYVNENYDLVPIAMQLIPYDTESIFSSTDDYYDWLLAKMYYRAAAANLHQVIVDSCAATGLARSAFKDFNMKDLVFPQVIKERGLDDRDILRKNYYRDDALKLWEIINEFVSSIITIYYKRDQDVKEDDEIQAFAKDVAIEGLGWEDGNAKGMPQNIENVEQLTLICTVLIYTSSVSHASVNFPQYQNYQFVPNAPAAMRLPPHKKGEGTIERIMESLPDLTMATIQVTIPYVLSFYSPDEVYLGEYPMRLFTDHRALAAMERYRSKLSRYFDEVDERNKNAGDDAYIWLGRNKVPNSIAV